MLLLAVEMAIPDHRFGESSQDKRADEGPRHSTSEAHMVILGFELEVDIVCWHAVFQYVVRGLDVEGFFNLRIARLI